MGHFENERDKALTELNTLSFVQTDHFHEVWDKIEVIIDDEIDHILIGDHSSEWKVGAVAALRTLRIKPYKRFDELSRKVERYDEHIQARDGSRTGHAIPFESKF